MGNNDTNLKLANVIFDLAKNSEESGKYEDAIKSYKKASNVFKQAFGTEDEKTKEVYYNIEMCYKALGNNEEALTYLTKALSSSNATSVVPKQKETKKTKETKADRLNQAEELVGLGDENYYDENYDEAISYYNEAIEIYNHLYDFDNVKSAECYYSIGLCYSLVDKAEISIYYLKKSLRVFQLKNHHLEDEVIERINKNKRRILFNSLIQYDDYEDYNEDNYEYEEDDYHKAMGMFDDMVGNASESDIRRIDDKIGGMKKGKLAEVWDKVMKLYRFIKDPNAPWGRKALAIGALIYMISPLDAVPDPIPIVGLLDDVGIITAAFTKLANELKKYR